MDKLSNIITTFYIKKAYIPEDKREIYNYGFKLIIADIINFSMVILLGVMLGKSIESIIFIITLCSVRQFSGGFHAKTFWRCRLSMMITFISVIIVSQLTKAVCYNFVLVIIDIISIVLIAVLAPVKNPNKILTECQRKKNKFKAIMTSFMLSAISIILTALDRFEGCTISITLAAVVVLMIIGISVQKGGNIDV